MSHHVPLVACAVQSRGPVLSGLMLDNGVALMAAHLLREGFSPKVFDYNSLHAVDAIARAGHDAFLEEVVEELAGYVAKHRVKLVGFKLYLNGFMGALEIARRLRERFPALVIVAGGPQVDWFTESLFDCARRAAGGRLFDALIYGDADVALPRIAESVYRTGEDLSGIPNLILPPGPDGQLRRTARRYYDLRDLPFPEYGPEIYDTSGKLLIPVIEDSRSCDVACTFCIQPRIGGRRRERGLDDVLREVEHYREAYGWRLFRLAGPKPTGAYLGELARGLPGDARFTAFGYADEDYQEVVASGKMVGLFTGLESTDPFILEQVYHKTDDTARYLDAARRMIDLFKRSGLVNVVSMIVPSPGETADGIRRTIDFMLETAPDFVPGLPVCPIPGTPLARLARKDPERAGVMLDDDYELKLAGFEVDLLRPSSSWPTPPWQVRVGGAWVRNAFTEVTAAFTGALARHGMHILSDEQVLMAYLYHGGLSRDQAERRRQCVDFHGAARAAIEAGDAASRRGLVARVNERQARRAEPAGRAPRRRAGLAGAPGGR
ncbi:MAG: radical SAM protein [Polyangiaceae bacterium]|nr:radical SAM protein [Polyangiaceae bacterium]